MGTGDGLFLCGMSGCFPCRFPGFCLIRKYIRYCIFSVFLYLYVLSG